MKKNYTLFTLFGALLLVSGSSKAASIYDNNISALNINILTGVFMSYTNYSDNMSDLFEHKKMYGSMDRLDEYGDDGSTIASYHNSKQDSAFGNIWINANHVNGDIHYGHHISQHSRFNLATIGANSKPVNLGYGNISFGGFASYINSKIPDTHANGDALGIFAKYKYQNWAGTLLADFGSLNNDSNGTKFNNSWMNVAAGASGTLKIDDTFFVRPDVYVSYVLISSSDLYVNSNNVSMSDFNFYNVAPRLTFIKEISPNWYGSLSAKHVVHFGDKNNINLGNTVTSGLYIDDHTDVGIDIEYDYKQFIFGANVHKQIGGIDSLSTNLNIKYAF